MTRQLIRIVGNAQLGFFLVFVNAMAKSAAKGVEVDSSWRNSDLVVSRTVVHFADLNLSREADVKEIYRRIRVAASIVCAPLRNTRSPVQVGQWHTCRETAIADAVAEIHHPSLSEYHVRLMAGNQQPPSVTDGIGSSRE
jgi:UrcA family protein